MKIAAFLIWGVGIVTVVVWLATGAPFVTRYEIPVTVVEEDEFGTVERTEMQPGFELGLMPDRAMVDGVLPIAALCAFGGAGLFLVDRRRSKAA